MKNNINKIVTFTIFDREDTITGLVLDLNENLTLISYNPVDFVLDGFIIINNESISDYEINNDIIKDKILNKKIIHEIEKKEKLTLDINFIFSFFLNKDIIFSLELKTGNYYIGKVNNVKSSSISFKILNSKCIWMDDINIDFENIDLIEYETDYIKSLKLILD